MMELEFFASCLTGLERSLADELKSFGIERVRPLGGGVAFFCTQREALRACLWSRLASRIMMVVGRVNAGDADLLYAGVYDLAWEDVLAADATFAVRAHGSNEALRNTRFTALKVKDAIVDRMRSKRAERPDVDTARSQGDKPKDRFLRLIAKEAGVRPDQILDTDLYLYSRTRACHVGMENEYIVSGRLDDLQCAFSSLQGILLAEPSGSVAVHCVFDNEEVGSGSKQGAGGTFLCDILHRINASLGRTEEGYLRAVASSFMVSADNAHAVHPDHPDKSDPTNRPYMNEGIVIKYNASQKYVTDAVSGAIFRALCKKAGVPCQTFTNRSDLAGGSTLGNIAQGQVSLNAVDIGLAQLAMHSACETAGARDTAFLVEAARVFFSGSVENTGDGKYNLRF